MNRTEHEAAIRTAVEQYERALRALIAAADAATEGQERPLKNLERGALELPLRVVAVVLKDWRDK